MLHPPRCSSLLFLSMGFGPSRGDVTRYRRGKLDPLSTNRGWAMYHSSWFHACSGRSASNSISEGLLPILTILMLIINILPTWSFLPIPASRFLLSRRSKFRFLIPTSHMKILSQVCSSGFPS
ncbi:hypothetical protein BD779DRAFT_371247 [Infundibulicybe gibba]|nr:hypothetical protein BD779DRAFT_371247 [Infundibulicybe gibba]